MDEITYLSAYQPKTIPKTFEVMNQIPKNPRALTSEIHLKSQDYDGWFILLEGRFDKKFFDSRINQSNLKPIDCAGRQNLLDTLDLLTPASTTQNIIALADKDYDKILDRLKKYPQLIYTDKNDLEVTLLHCPSIGVSIALERILEESVDEDKIISFNQSAGHSVVENIRLIASNYGVLRLINEELKCCVKFEELSIINKTFFNHLHLKQDEYALKNYFINAANEIGNTNITMEDLNTNINKYKTNGLFQGWDLVQGHDLMLLLSTSINSNKLRKETGHRQASEDSLARDLCLMIHKEHLRATDMFQRLLSMENTAGVSLFK